MKNKIERTVAALLAAARDIELQAAAKASHLRMLAGDLAEFHARMDAGQSATSTTDERSIDQLEVPIRVVKGLHHIGAKMVSDIQHLPDDEFLRIPNFGKESLRWIRQEIGPAKPPFISLALKQTTGTYGVKLP